jgi:hypothetical protein
LLERLEAAGYLQATPQTNHSHALPIAGRAWEPTGGADT